MSLVLRGVVLFIATIANLVLFIFHSRVLLELVEVVNSFGTGPATPAVELLPQAVLLAIVIIQGAAIAYFLGAFGQQRTVQRRPG